MNVYTGNYDNDYYVLKNGEIFDPKPSLKVRNHSPDGFSWGYHGSGPAQLALGILLEELGEKLAEILYQDFKRDIIANLSAPWKLTTEDVIRWFDEHGKRNQV